MGDLTWLGGNRLAFLGAGIMVGWAMALLLFVWLQGKQRGLKNLGGDPLAVGKIERAATAQPLSSMSFDTVLGHKALADALKALHAAGLLHVLRDGERPRDGLNVKALHDRHPSAAVVALASGQQIARLWAFRGGKSQLEVMTTNTVNPPDASHVGYLDIADDPNPFSVPGFEAQEIGKGQQPEYRILQAVRGPAPEYAAISRWTLTLEQRAAIRDGQDIWLEQWTFGQPFQPVRLCIGVPEELMAALPVPG